MVAHASESRREEERYGPNHNRYAHPCTATAAQFPVAQRTLSQHALSALSPRHPHNALVVSRHQCAEQP